MCAALLNPSSAEPLVWPSPLKFISELNQEAKALLECALMEANRERERNILMEANREREKNIMKGSGHSLPSPSHSADGTDYNISEVISMLICTYGIMFNFIPFNQQETNVNNQILQLWICWELESFTQKMGQCFKTETSFESLNFKSLKFSCELMF